MAEAPHDTHDDETTTLARLVSGWPMRADAAAGASARVVAQHLAQLGPDELAKESDPALLRAGSALLSTGDDEAAARCFAALDSREAVAGTARLGLAWASWARGQADACADGLRAAMELDAGLDLLPEGSTLVQVRARAGALSVLAAKDDDGEHDVERIGLERPLLPAEREALEAAAEALAGLQASAVAGYGELSVLEHGARIRRASRPGAPLSTQLGEAPRSLEDALAIVEPLAAGLSAAHGAGVTHGAVGAELVGMGDDGPVLHGLGLGSVLAPTTADVASGRVAPERLSGGPASAAADAYALAALLYRLLTGHDPLGAVPRPSAQGLDARLDELFAQALHPDPASRSSVDALLEQAREIATTKAPPAAAPSAAVGPALSQPIVIPDDASDLDAWLDILARKPTHKQAREALVAIEQQARADAAWDRVAEVLTARIEHAEVQQQRVQWRRELAELYERKLEAPASAFRQVQLLIEDVSVTEQIVLIAELRRLAEITGQWGPLTESLSSVAQRAPEPVDQARLYTGLGRVYAERLGDSDQALSAYEQAIGIEANASNLAAAAGLYRKSGQTAELAATLLNLADHQEGEDRAASLRDVASVLHDDLGDVEGAFATLRVALEVEPGHPEALEAAETFARELEDWHSLVELLDQRAEASSLDDRAVRELRTEAAAIAAEQLADPAQAVAQLEKILAREPRHEPTARLRVEHLRGLAEQDPTRRSDLDQALGALVELVERKDEKAALWSEQAALLDTEPEGKARAAQCRERIVETLGFEHEVVQQAAEALQRWYRREEQHEALLALLRRAGTSKDAETPSRVDAWSKAFELLSEGPVADEDGAVEALEALTALAPDDHRWRDALLERYLAREDFEKAGPLIRAQVYDDDIDPKRKAALLWRGGQLREQLGKAEGAMEALEEAVQLDPSLHDAWLALRDLYRQRDQPLKAIEAQVSAARAHPSRQERTALTFEAAKTYLDVLGQPDKGLALLEELVEFDPDHREATGMLVERLVSEGDLARAWPIAQTWVAQVRAQAADDKALNVRALSITGRCALAVEEPERAREYLEKARNADATNFDVLRLLGELDMDAERWEDALRSYQSVVLGAAKELSPPELSQVYLRMADARLGMDERSKALQLIERALDIDPDQRAAIDKLVEVAENPADQVKAKLRLAELLATREQRLEGDAQEPVRAERIALLQQIAQIQLEELQAPGDAARTLETVLAMDPSDPAILHGLLDVFTKAGRWRDVAHVLDLLSAGQDTGPMRAKYLYAGAAIFRDQLDDADSFVAWAQRVLEADPSHDKAFRGICDQLEKKEAWKDLAKQLRGRLKSLPKDAPIESKIGLFVKLGEVYEERLGDAKTALAAYSQAVRFAPAEIDNAPQTRQRRVKIMELALSLGEDELDKAIVQGHALIAGDPMEFDTYHRLVGLYRKRGNEDRATALARTLAFLRQANEDEQALMTAQAEREAQIRSVVTSEQWRKNLYHGQQDARLTEIFAVVWPMVAAREGHTHASQSVEREQRAKLSMTSDDALARYLAYAAQIFDVPTPDYFPRPKVPGGVRVDALCEGEGDRRRVYPTVIAGRDTLRDDSEPGLKFRAAAAIARVRPGHILASVLPSETSLRQVFYGTAALSGQEGLEIPPDIATEAELLRKHLKRFITPEQREMLGALATKVLDKGQPDLQAWVRGVAYTASRAGLVLCDSIDSAARVLTQQGDEGMPVPFKDRVRDLVAYSVSLPYLKLRQDLGLSR